MLIEVGQAIEQIKTLEGFLPEATKEELAQILAFGEKMKAEGEKMEEEFWNKYDRNNFRNLLIQYEETKEKFMESLAPEDRKMLDNLNWLSKDKFYNEYLYKSIIYSGDVNRKYDYSGFVSYENEDGNFDLERFKDWVDSSKDRLKPWMRIYLDNIQIGYEGIKILAETWKDKLQPGMKINLWGNKLGYEGLKILTEAWKNSLKPGMTIDLKGNNIGYEGAKILAETWKDKLQPGMEIRLSGNSIGYEGVKILAETWKNSLKPGMKIDLSNNDLGEKGIEAIMQNLELKEWVVLDLRGNKEISDRMKKELEKWVQGYEDQGINCIVLV